MTPPRVSVLVPTWNGAAFLEEALRSVLAQSFSDFELVVVDDASADNTVEVAAAIRDPRLRVLRHPERLRIPGNWNRALAAARAPLVKFLFQDDILFPGALARLVEALEKQPDAILAFGRREIRHEGADGHLPLQGDVYTAALRQFYAGLDGHLTGLGLVTRALDRGPDLTLNVVGEPSFVLLRREPALAVRGFDPRFHQLGDWDLWLRLARRGPLVFVDESLGVFRVHGLGQSALNHTRFRTRWELLELLAMVQREYAPLLSPDGRRKLVRTRWRYRAHVAGETLRRLLGRSPQESRPPHP